MADKDKKIEALSNFTGSNAVALITKDSAILWTDSRYYIQAEKQLNSYWKMIPIENGSNVLKNFIKDNLKGNSKRIAVNYKNFSLQDLSDIKEYLNQHNFELINDLENIPDKIIIKKVSMESKSNIPNSCHAFTNTNNNKQIFKHELKFSGCLPLEKFKFIKSNFNEYYSKYNKGINLITNSNGYAIVINKLDEIAC